MFAGAIGIVADAAAGNSSLAPLIFLAEDADTAPPVPDVTGEQGAAAQALIAGMQSSFIFDQGDLTMLIMDMPDVPPQFTPFIVAQKSQAAQPNTERTIGVCHPIENKPESKLSAINTISPLGEASSYLENIEHKKIDWSLVKSTIKMTLLQAPMHGKLELFEAQQAGSYDATDYNYEGPDRATVLVEIGAYKVKVIYHFVLMHDVPGSGDEGEATDDKRICPNGYIWKISFNPDDPNAPVYTVQRPIQMTSAYAALNSINLEFADLPGGAVWEQKGPGSDFRLIWGCRLPHASPPARPSAAHRTARSKPPALLLQDKRELTPFKQQKKRGQARISV